MSSLDQFESISRFDEPLAPHTWLKVGGPAQVFIEPRTHDELKQVLQAATEDGLPVRVLGAGSNLLVRDEGISGVVLHIAGEEFSRMEIRDSLLRAGGGALLSNVVSHSVASGLAGLESLVGIPGTLGGAVRGNAGGRHGDIGEHVQAVTVMTSKGETFRREGDELSFAYRFSSINELVILEAELLLRPDDVEELTQRMRTLWITKKAAQPFSFQSAGCIFKNPRGLSAGKLIEQAGLKGAKVGLAEVSDRHANFVVTHEGATSADVLNLIELIRSRVHEAHGVELELEIKIW